MELAEAIARLKKEVEEKREPEAPAVSAPHPS
jgi:hypothetical protein